MMQHVDILDTHDSMRAPFVAALTLHASLLAGSLIYAWWSHSAAFGAPDAGGGAVGVEAVDKIPLPHEGAPNPLANDSKSEVPQEKAPPIERAKAEKPDPDAIAIKTKKERKKLADVASERQRFRPIEELQPNQLTTTRAPQVSNPLYSAQPGAGRIGTGANTTLGVQFAGYAAQIQSLVARKWRTGDVDPKIQTAPVVIATFELMRDGSVRNIQLLQASGISALDFSVQRAIQDASPFPPIPPAFQKDYAKVEFWFELKR